MPARVYNDLAIGYEVNAPDRLTVGMNNVFNVKPPQIPSTYTGAGGIYDTLGRYFFISASAKL